MKPLSGVVWIRSPELLSTVQMRVRQRGYSIASQAFFSCTRQHAEFTPPIVA
jgi:hypothetical protein